MSALDKIVEMFPNRLSDINLDPYRNDEYKPRIKNAIDYAEAMKARVKQRGSWGDRTGFDIDQNFRFRPYELTIWTGYKGHGKSALMSQVLLKLIQQKKKIFVCSPEFHPVELLYRFLVQLMATDDPSEEEAMAMLELLSDWLWVYDVQASLKPNDVAALCRYVAETLKPDHIVIDSLMKCGIAPDDYARQKQLVDQIQTVAHQNPLHIHLVAHARKGNDDKKPAALHDIKGASEIGDMVENVLSVWRNKPKEKGECKDPSIEPDAILVVEAQRNCGGWIGNVPLMFNREAMTYFEMGKDFRNYVSIGQKEEFL